MKCDVLNLSLFTLQNQVKRGELKIDEFDPIEVTNDVPFILKHEVPIKPLLVIKGEIKLGSGMMRDIFDYFESQEFCSLPDSSQRRIQEYMVKVYVLRDDEGIDVDKLLRQWCR